MKCYYRVDVSPMNWYAEMVFAQSRKALDESKPRLGYTAGVPRKGTVEMLVPGADVRQIKREIGRSGRCFIEI